MFRSRYGKLTVSACCVLCAVLVCVIAGQGRAQEEAAAYGVARVEMLLMVPSIEETGEWYGKVLGWQARRLAFDDQGKCTYATVYLPRPAGAGQQDRLRGFNLGTFGVNPETYGTADRNLVISVTVDDVDAVYERVTANGVVAEAPQNQPWGARTFTMTDPNGFVLSFSQPTAPAAGPPG